MRLVGFAVSMVGLAACAQGVQDNFSDIDGDAGASALAGSGNAPSGFSGAPSGSSGAPGAGGSKGGATGSAGRGGGSSAGAAGKGGATGTAGATGSAGSGTGPQGCSHPQPGSEGMTLSYQAKDAAMSVPYIYFRVEIKNPDDPIALSDLKVRYYLKNDLTSPATDFYSPQIKHANGNTDNLGANDISMTYMPTYMEVGFTSAAFLAKGETLTFEVHAHSNPSPTPHDQSMDYSFTASTSLMPWCNITLHQLTALAWGTPPP